MQKYAKSFIKIITSLSIVLSSLALAAEEKGAGGPSIKLQSLPNNIRNIFAQNGFSKPNNITVMWGGQGFGALDNIHLGGGGWGGGNSAKRGNESIEYALGYGGFMLGYEYSLASTPLSLLGKVLVGGGGATLEMYTQALSGQIVEGLFVLEPSLGFYWTPLEFLSTGVAATYFLPVRLGREIKGSNLNIDRLVYPAPALRFDIFFGKLQ